MKFRRMRRSCRVVFTSILCCSASWRSSASEDEASDTFVEKSSQETSETMIDDRLLDYQWSWRCGVSTSNSSPSLGDDGDDDDKDEGDHAMSDPKSRTQYTTPFKVQKWRHRYTTRSCTVSCYLRNLVRASARVQDIQHRQILSNATVLPFDDFFSSLELMIVSTLFQNFYALSHKLQQGLLYIGAQVQATQDEVRRRSKPVAGMKPQTSVARRAVCTHVTTERLYGEYNCCVCNRPGELGYVYTCTQDHDQAFDLDAVRRVVDPNNVRDDTRSEGRPWECFAPATTKQPPSSLSAWVQKAIENGEYTDEQINILHEQRKNLNEVVRTVAARFEDGDNTGQPLTPNPPAEIAVSVKETPPQQSMNPSSPPTPVDTSTQRASNPETNSVEGSHDEKPPTPPPSPSLKPIPTLHPITPHKRKHSATFTSSPAPTTPAPSPPNKPYPSRLYPWCTFTACHVCRPTYRDRSWASLDEAFAFTPTTGLPTLESLVQESYGPQISDANLMRRIGLRGAGLIRGIKVGKGPMKQIDEYGTSSEESTSSSSSESTEYDFVPEREVGSAGVDGGGEESRLRYAASEKLEQRSLDEHLATTAAKAAAQTHSTPQPHDGLAEVDITDAKAAAAAAATSSNNGFPATALPFRPQNPSSAAFVPGTNGPKRAGSVRGSIQGKVKRWVERRGRGGEESGKEREEGEVDVVDAEKRDEDEDGLVREVSVTEEAVEVRAPDLVVSV